MRREELFSDLGRFSQVSQLKKRASTGRTGARRRMAREATLPTGANSSGVARGKRERRSLVKKRCRLARVLLEQVQKLRGIVELTADTEPRRKLDTVLWWQLGRLCESGLWFVRKHGRVVPGVRGRLA